MISDSPMIIEPSTTPSAVFWSSSSSFRREKGDTLAMTKNAMAKTTIPTSEKTTTSINALSVCSGMICLLQISSLPPREPAVPEVARAVPAGGGTDARVDALLRRAENPAAAHAAPGEEGKRRDHPHSVEPGHGQPPPPPEPRFEFSQRAR